MKKRWNIIICVLLALGLLGCQGGPEATAETAAPSDPTETGVEIVVSGLSEEERSRRYLDALGVDLGELEGSRISVGGSVYVFRGPGALYAFGEYSQLGQLQYDPSLSGAMTTDCELLEGCRVTRITGGCPEEVLNVEGEGYCSFLFLPEDGPEVPEYEYEDNGDGTVTILRYNGEEADVTIPAEIDGKKVAALGCLDSSLGAFAYSPTVVSVVIPEGVTKVDHFAFASCQRLETVVFPESLREMGVGVFQHSPLVRELHFNGPAVGSDHAERMFDGPVDGLELEGPPEWYPKGLDLKDIEVYYPQYALGWTPQDWEAFTKVPY